MQLAHTVLSYSNFYNKLTNLLHNVSTRHYFNLVKWSIASADQRTGKVTTVCDPVQTTRNLLLIVHTEQTYLSLHSSPTTASNLSKNLMCVILKATDNADMLPQPVTVIRETGITCWYR